MTTIDQVTLIGPNDVASLPYHMRFSARNIPFLRKTFYIIPGDTAFRQRLETVCAGIQKEFFEKSIFVPEETLLAPSVCENKWIYQQLVKLSAYRLNGLSEMFLFTDIDTLCLRPVTFDELVVRNDYPYWVSHYQGEQEFVAPDFNAIQFVEDIPAIDGQQLSWLIGFSWSSLNLLGLERMQCMSAVNACVIWSQTVLKALIAFIEKRSGMPFHDAVTACFRAFIAAHKDHFYRYPGYRQVMMTYYPPETFTRCTDDEETLYRTLRIGFSEWQLYTYFLSMCRQHPYVIHAQPPNKNEWIGEFNSELLSLEVLTNVLKQADQGGKRCRFVNFYPNITENIRHFLDSDTLVCVRGE